MTMADEYTGEHKRSEDRAWSWKVARHWAQWSWTIAPLTALVVSAGFGFSTPTKHFNDINARIDQLDRKLTTRMDTLQLKQEAGYNDRVDQRKLLEFIARARCSELSDHKKEVLGGTEVCDGAFHPLDHAIKAKIRASMEPIQ
jgi:hypothetical protein